MSRFRLLPLFTLMIGLAARPVEGQVDPLPSWNDGSAKQAIVAFVEKVTKPGGPDFVPIPDRIAAFDNDGTLWAEQPAYAQVAFALDRIKALAPSHPEWQDKPLFKAAIEGDLKPILTGTTRDRLGTCRRKSRWDDV